MLEWVTHTFIGIDLATVVDPAISCKLQVNGSAWAGASAGANGSALCINGRLMQTGRIIVSGSTFVNSSAVFGGAVHISSHLHGRMLFLSGTKLRNTLAKQAGGAIYVGGMLTGTLHLNKSYVVNSSVVSVPYTDGAGGGAIHIPYLH